VAKETGDLVLMRGQINDLLLARDMGKRTLRGIRQNLFRLASLVSSFYLATPSASRSQQALFAMVWAGLSGISFG
jgi:cation transport ATPase